MIEAPSVISPAGPPRPSTGTNSTATATPEGDDINNGEICCICDVSDDDGFTICCDKCNTWQHFICVGIAKQEVPKYYLCPKCDPRELDVEKAREHQRSRRERERHKVKVPPPPKKKSHKRKESTTVAHASTFITPSLPPPSLEPKQATPRNPSPSHSTTTNTTSHKKRTNRSTGPTTQDGGRSGRTSPTHSKRGEDSDTDAEKAPKSYKLEFDDLGDKPDVYMGKEVVDFVEKVTHQRESSSQPLRYYGKDQFSSLHFPRLSVRQLISPKGNANPRWRYRLVTENVCEKGSLVALFKGEVGFKDTYKESTYNQYPLIQHPKQFVLFHPNLPLYVDARKHGVDCRFARISCKPTLSLQTVVVEGGSVGLGLFATANMKSGSELTVPWFWEASDSASRIMSLKDTDPSAIPPEDLLKAGEWASKVLSHFGECACGGGEDRCILRKLNVNRPTNHRAHLPNGTKKRSKVATDHMRVPHTNLQSTPDVDELRAPRSRSHNLEDALTPHDNGEMSKREAQKMKQYAAQFERMEQTENLQPNIKRRKRTNAVTPLGGDAKDDSSDNGKKPKTAAESPKSTTTVSSPHHNNGRQCSESGSVGSEVSSPSSVIKRKRPVYVDAAIQTDDNVPVWLRSSGPVSPPPTGPPLSLKKRLMLCLSNDKQEKQEKPSTPIPEERKRKRTGSLSEGSPSRSPKEPKLAEGVSVPLITEPALEIDQDIKMEDCTPAPTTEVEIPVVPKVEANQTMSPVASKSPTPVGDISSHASADVSPPSTGVTPQPTVEKKESPSPGLEASASPSISGKRPGLNLELPPPTLFSNGVTTSVAASTTDRPATVQSSETATLPTPYSPSLTDSGVQPGPRAKKVLSLGEYKKRQKRNDNDKPTPKREEAHEGDSGKENKEAASAVAV
ncbi:hypothetical protein BJ508DRAFT_320456 [Ascobolus immersus RN42]|uniref:PHD-type domain-containing protein n=1 Tax=Ascobolus immersus RN42 TaxID=1160509 RepID=A0A3N4IMT4_ASCIM|nr:hypothetical protein BJ508DRAFT_320456 [Ascobolus immersus RN42]